MACALSMPGTRAAEASSASPSPRACRRPPSPSALPPQAGPPLARPPAAHHCASTACTARLRVTHGQRAVTHDPHKLPRAP
eukprot:6538540-Prymnesium_polylepis.1